MINWSKCLRAKEFEHFYELSKLSRPRRCWGCKAVIRGILEVKMLRGNSGYNKRKLSENGTY